MPEEGWRVAFIYNDALFSYLPRLRRCRWLTDLEDKVREAVGKVVDVETGLTFAEMHMITGVKEEAPGIIRVDFVPSSPYCPIAFKLALDVKNAALKVNGVKKALVYCHGHMMEEQINEMVNADAEERKKK
ncbi:iron-sulfur cluster assembly protein [Candidatus Bathyarchaeota archaeon]|nr:iron-sulfur cluster assembly protein [Candidatus Bathyarchaeota archaeon]